MTDTERSMITLQELLRSTSVTVDQYKEAIYFCVATDTSQVDESKKESYCDACVTALIHLMKYTAPSTDDPKAFCLDLIQLQLTLHLTLYPNFVSSKFVIACAALAELYPLSAKEFAKPVLQMAEKFHSFNTFDLKQIGFGRRRQVSDLPKCLQDLCLFFYSEISVYWSLAVTAESNAERQLIARAAIKKASTLAYLPCHADIDLKLLDLIHIAYTDGIQKSDALCFLPWWVSFLIVLVLTVMAALLLPSRHSVCWARMLSTFCLLPVMIKSLGFELLAVSLPTAILNIGFCLLLSYLTAPVLLELIFVSYLYQK